MNEYNEYGANPESSNNTDEPVISGYNDEKTIDDAVSENVNNMQTADIKPVYVPYQQQPAPKGNHYEPINYTPVQPKKTVSVGIKVFALIMAGIILATGSCLAGYLLGNNRNRVSHYSETTLDLTAKPADTDEYTAAQVYEIVNKSVVGITVYNQSGAASYASGVVYTEDGYIITNDHIYDGIAGAKFRVRFYDGAEYPAVFVAGDTRSDLAVIKIDGNGFTPAVFGDSAQIVIGENVVAVGRPNQIEENSITEGIISLKDRRVSTTTNYSMKMIQTSTPINPGNSGGALVNMYGQVIGITSSKIGGDGYEGIGFAIPTTTTKWVVESLIAYGCVNDRARLGITYQTISEISKEVNGYKTTGILIASVAEDSDLYGKINQGDIITEINGTSITSDSVVLDTIESLKPDDKIELTVYTSSGSTKNITAKLLPDTGTSSYVFATAN